ncbi:hypothetical protein WICPIJ_002261 [Wickerhamomyces pijperi]|uniref:Cytochrome b5 heme-binding domain-containing protein n=1 Tax=Wickerhamomyces pijperi TaxID=599730 RepID=A0A9P8QA42_WICPI|nr:hypothetical protein WICPIJ_002261 [Wickerhamomyces pijperi]
MSFIKNLIFPVKTTDPVATNSDCTNSSNAAPEPIVEGLFTPKTLYKFNGHDDEKIFISVKGTVFDCSAGRQFYGPSGPYSNFAGHDASRGLALNSFDMADVRDWDQPIDDLKDLKPEESEALDGWEEHFKKKYPVVGKLVPEEGSK